jgi:6-phosphogluconolactonase (cycloisomerase 2 family)
MIRALFRSSCVSVVFAASASGCLGLETGTDSGIATGSGTVSQTASPSSYTVGGSVNGLVGSGLVLTDNGGDALTLSAGATSFKFATPIASNHTFDVAVMAQPNGPGENCTVAHNQGTSNANVNDVAVTCTNPSYKISGTVTGLSGTGLTLSDSRAGTVSVTSAGAFALPNAIQGGIAYAVTVAKNPTDPLQGCTVTNGTGSIAASNVTNVTVVCNDATEELLTADTVADVVPYVIDPQTGSLAPARTTPVSMGSGQTHLIVDPTGTYVYLSPIAGSSIGAYSLNPQTGALTPISGSPFPVGATAGRLVIDASGSFLYTATPAGVYAFARDASTGAIAPVAGSPFAVAGPGQLDGFAAATSAFVYYFSYTSGNQYQLGGFAINTSTGALTTASVSSATFPIPYGFGAANPSGNLLSFTSDGVESFSIDPTTGALTLGDNATGGSINTLTNIVMNPAGTFAYATNGAVVYAFSVDAATGVLTATADSPFATNAAQDVNVSGSSLIVFDQTGQYLYVGNREANSIIGFAVDPDSGDLTPLPGSPYRGYLSLYTMVSATIP